MFQVKRVRPVSNAVATAWLACSLLCGIAGAEDESKDVALTVRYAAAHPSTARVYYNGRPIGAGRDAFASVVQRIGKLPAGTSIVWGPNYDRCGACSGDEPGCVAKFLYPALWKRLGALVEQRQLTLSSAYPGPWPRAVGKDEYDRMPATLSTDDPAIKEPFDAILDWEISDVVKDHNEKTSLIRYGEYWHRFTAAGTELSEFDREQYLGRLPEASSVLVRISLEQAAALDQGAKNLRRLGSVIRDVWRHEFEMLLRLGRLNAKLAAPPRLAEVLRRIDKDRLAVDWSNYHGPETPREEVLYFVDGDFVGRGDEGFDRILARADAMPEGSEIVLPRYAHGGRAALETLSPEELATKNAELQEIAPYGARRSELDSVIRKRKLNATFDENYSLSLEPRTVMDWDSGDRYAQAFVSFGRIVRHDETRRPAAVRLDWIGYEPSNRREGSRQVETEALYALNGAELGRGVPGFAKAMEQCAALPKGAVVQVRVCIRTKGPFLCPLTYQNQRHFERTGFEPYFGMFPWLIDVARKHGLQVEWTPDEQKSCADCELNR